MKDVDKYEQIGTTIDDALGEAFDKTAKMLNLGYPEAKCRKIFEMGDKNYLNYQNQLLEGQDANSLICWLKNSGTQKI